MNKVKVNATMHSLERNHLSRGFDDSRTVEDEILVDPVDTPEILDDFELGEEGIIDIKDREVNQQKLRRRIEQFKVIFLCSLRTALLSINSCVQAVDEL